MPPSETKRRDWAGLGDGLTGMIADRVLAYDVADYLRFRAVCGPWRRCCADPRAHGGLDRRFHPRRWLMLREPRERIDAPNRRRFLNSSTGECIQVHLPELHNQEVLALTAEGLLVVLDWPRSTKGNDCLLFTAAFDTHFPAWGSGVLSDDSTVALSFNRLNILGMAKPGDDHWTVLEFRNPLQTASSMVAGRFYCVTIDGVMVLEDQPPRLELAARLPMPVSPTSDTVHLMDNAGELTLVHRRFSRHHDNNNMAKRRYDVYRLDPGAGTLCRVNSFGGDGHALFIGMYCSLSVPTKIFPSGSIRGDTVYLSFDIAERNKTEGYHLADRSAISSDILNSRSALQPHNLVDCLSLCTTGRIWCHFEKHLVSRCR
ncbi:hypothetical protein CFC21_104559 [Triticum aestivum]|uniref:KIB1-4 beta-propeller domain-containing protein n=2 Tax=Triticum aestivum TaxID=4565 RepID=A0A3B6SL24_WHEAT|nr:hypothetical protein CFC21_104559 [Triticum aestivum]